MSNPINKERIASLFGEIRKALGILMEYQKMSKIEVVGDLKVLGGIKYYFIVSIEGCIDICNHLVAKEYVEAPESYFDCFRILGEKGIIPTDLAEKMGSLAKFRNLLVHLYWKVDDGKVYDFLHGEPPLIEDFLTAIRNKYFSD
ncbi:MAG: DUF86 domain-containing protein [Proteobacteria bacterium]|nr:DUF86 domain-containing protein [Pseudomonadota bacterium]